MMKAVAINGSPRKEGNTHFALKIVTAELEKAGIETEIIQIGGKDIRGCTACGECRENRDEKCVLKGDDVNELLQKMKGADCIILGSPVYYSSIAGTMKSFLDRVFYVSGANGNLFRHKVGAAVAAVRRSGGIPTFDQLCKYLLYSEMIIPGSSYWNVIHGRQPEEAAQDEEGQQIMRVLGKNIAWVMRLIDNGKALVEEPGREDKVSTNFIR